MELKKEKLNIKGRVKLIFRNIYTGEKRETEWKNNLITNAGKVAILRRLKNAASQSNEGMITYGAVGTSTTAPAVGDTTLGTELERAVLSYTTITSQTLELRVYFTTSEAVGTLKEFGWFGEAAGAGADSGTLFTHIAIDETKTNSETLTIVQDIDL